MQATKHPGVKRLGPGRYLIRGTYTDPKTSKRRNLVREVETRSAAEAAAERKRLVDEARAGRTPQARWTLAAYARSWAEAKGPALAESTRRHYAQVLGTHVLPALGDVYVDALVKDDVMHWLAEQEATGVVYDTVASRFRVLRTVLADACDELGLRDPLARYRYVRAETLEDDEEDAGKCLTASELGALLRAARDLPDYPVIRLLAVTGARWGAVSALRWRDIDWQAQTVTIRRAQTHGGHLKRPKTRKSIRVLPLDRETLDALSEQRRRILRAEEELARKEQRPPDLGVIGEAAWCFPSSKGTPRYPSTITGPIREAAAAAKIDRPVSAKWFRHTMNRLLRLAAQRKVQQAMLGHATDAMSEHYDAVPIHEKRAAHEAVLRLVASGEDRNRH